jgi:IS4 transposase
VFKACDRRNVSFFVPAKKVEPLKLTYRIAEVVQKWHWNYVLSPGKENEYTAKVCLEEVGVDDFVGMISNRDMTGMDVELLFQDYRLRWNIENSYKEAQTYRAKTNSRNHAYRILVYALSHLLMDLQVLAKRIGKTTITRSDMELIITLLLTGRHTIRRLTKKLVVTV